ncbi:MAG: hypothetical protein HFH68_10995 [Lachnospiraceae bacterium]|nr:hypothetical protein [Lachnospiraceae bacterium]
MLKSWIQDIQEKTSDMSGRKKVSYVVTYYWYHVLIAMTVIALVVLFLSHLLLRKDPEFTCVVVNQSMNDTWEKNVEEEFSKELGVSVDSVVVDPDYHFSYDNVKLEGVNESSYEKFFLKWQYGELDAVILPESFYQHCVKMSGRFFEVDKMDTGKMKIYEDNGNYTAVVLEEDYNGERLLLAFPSSGKHKETCGKFLSFIKNIQKQGGSNNED